MTWAKFDDRFDDNPKIKAAWKRSPASIGLYVMAVTYSARHELDGRIDPAWLQDRLKHPKQRTVTLATLVECGLFIPESDGFYRVHDYLAHNPSKAKLQAKREADRARKAKGGSARNPNGGDAESDTPSGSPIPSRPVPTHPVPAAAAIPQRIGQWLDGLFSSGQQHGYRWATDITLVEQQRAAVASLIEQTGPGQQISVMRDIGDEVRGGTLKGKLSEAVRSFITQAELRAAPSPGVAAYRGAVGGTGVYSPEERAALAARSEVSE